MPRHKKSAPQQEGRIVEASLAAGVHGGIGASSALGAAVEQAMADAAMRAMREGVTDQAEILKLKLAARDQAITDASRNVPGSRAVAAPAAEKQAAKAAKAKK